MVTANEVPGTVVADGTVALFKPADGPKKDVQGYLSERRKVLFTKLKLSGLESWMEENKDKALNLLVEYHDIFMLEDGEMGCTKAAEHKIEGMDPRPFKRD